MTTGVDGSIYTYDSQNRLLTATKSGSTETFKYDGLNRQVSRKIGSASPVYNVYDGWNLIAEYQPAATTPLNAYVYGAGGLVKLITASSSFYYYQDASGCTSHLADNTGHLVEWYRYDLQGTPIVYDPADNVRSGGSLYGIRCLFTGQQWVSELGLYDLRNRFYSPDIGRFLHADPIGFDGDANNLYRYCGNNPLNCLDPEGLSGTITIYSHYGNGGASLWGDTGHSWISFTSDVTGITHTYATYGNNPGGLPNGLRTDLEQYSYSDVSRSAWIDDAGEAQLNAYLGYMRSLGPDAWQVGFTGPCSTFAAIAWASATAENLRYRNADGYGWSTPSALATSIQTANGGATYGYLFADGSSGYYYPDGEYGIYDRNGNGYYIYNPNGAPGDIVGQTTGGEPIYEGRLAGGLSDADSAGGSLGGGGVIWNFEKLVFQ